MYRLLVGFFFVSLVYSCEKAENINAIFTPKGGSTNITVKNGFEFFDTVYIHTAFTAKTLGIYKRTQSTYTLVLEEVDSTSGKLMNQLLLNFTKYDFGSCSIDSGQFVTMLHGAPQVFDMPSDHSAQVFISQEGNTGQLVSGTFWFPGYGGNGELNKIEGSFTAYLLPDTE